MASSLNIVLFGQTGAGKSSVVNLIAGAQIAQISNGAAGCTLSFKCYSFPVNGRTLHIWDTVGLDEPEMEMDAIKQAYNLIQTLMNGGGVDLLLFCLRAPRVTVTSQANYKLFYESLCGSRVPIALVVTHLEREMDMERWWEMNAGKLEKFGLKFTGHACVTGLLADCKYQESRQNITKLLQGYYGNGRFNMPADTWFAESLRSLGRFALLKKKPKEKDIMQVLVKRCNLDPETARRIADMMEGGLEA